MALSPSQENFVSRVQGFAQLMNAQYGEIVQLNALWYGDTANYNDLITDQELAATGSLAHLTAAELNEIMYIVGQLKTLLDARLEQLAVVGQ